MRSSSSNLSKDKYQSWLIYDWWQVAPALSCFTGEYLVLCKCRRELDECHAQTLFHSLHLHSFPSCWLRLMSLDSISSWPTCWSIKAVSLCVSNKSQASFSLRGFPSDDTHVEVLTDCPLATLSDTATLISGVFLFSLPSRSCHHDGRLGAASETAPTVMGPCFKQPEPSLFFLHSWILCVSCHNMHEDPACGLVVNLLPFSTVLFCTLAAFTSLSACRRSSSDLWTSVSFCTSPRDSLNGLLLLSLLLHNPVFSLFYS